MNFTKMHGCGNDFVLIHHEQFSDIPKLSTDAIVRMADRCSGIGFDQLLQLQATGDPLHYKLSINNADGSIAGQCGNGLRCVACYLDVHRQQKYARWQIETLSGQYQVRSKGGGQYEAQLGIPEFSPKLIPFVAPAPANVYHIPSPWGVLVVGVVNVGNPHVVWRTQDLPEHIESQVRFLARCEQFSKGVNVNVIRIKQHNCIELNVYERGTGWTKACGSGACASAVVALQNHWLGADVIDVIQPGGCLQVAWAGAGQPVYLTGGAQFVFNGKLLLGDLALS